MTGVRQPRTRQPLFDDQCRLENSGQNDVTPEPVSACCMGATGAEVSAVVGDPSVDYTNPNIAPNYDAAPSQSLGARGRQQNDGARRTACG